MSPIVGTPDSLININNGTEFYKDVTGQPLNDEIKSGTRPYVIPNGAVIQFSMRYSNNNTLKVDHSAATIVDANMGEIRYSWAINDVNETGEFVGWWTINVSGISIDTDEFPIIIKDHSPGTRTRTGLIYEYAKSFMPITWTRLEESEHYGDKQLQMKVDIAKLSLLGTEISVEDEASLDIRVQSYIAKIAVINVIPAGKDYWAAMAVSKSTTGTDETVSYPDRIEMLEQLHDQLVQEIAADRDDISEIIDLPTIRRSNSVPAVSDGTDEGYITPNPHTNFRDYGFAVRGNRGGRRRAVDIGYWGF